MGSTFSSRPMINSITVGPSWLAFAARSAGPMSLALWTRIPAAPQLCPVRIPAVPGLPLDILGQIDHHHARLSRAGYVERLFYHHPQVRAVPYRDGPLADAPGDPHNIHLLEGVVPDQMRGHLPGKTDEGHAVVVCRRNTRSPGVSTPSSSSAFTTNSAPVISIFLSSFLCMQVFACIHCEILAAACSCGPNCIPAAAG